jgi:hypothetical protein
MKFRYAFLVTALLMPLVGQEAKIMIVERRDTTRLKAAYDKFKAAQKEWEALKVEVAKSYVTEGGKTMEGWEKVEYSVDFRAMVPARGSNITAYYGWPSTNIITTNAIGHTTALTGVTQATADLAVDVNTDLTTKERGTLTIKGTADNPGWISAESGDLTISSSQDGTLHIQGGEHKGAASLTVVGAPGKLEGESGDLKITSLPDGRLLLKGGMKERQ